MTSENTNPVPSQQVQIEAFLPPELLIAEQERCLEDHAHMLGVYWDALISEKVPFHLAETLIEEYSSDCLGVEVADE